MKLYKMSLTECSFVCEWYYWESRLKIKGKNVRLIKDNKIGGLAETDFRYANKKTISITLRYNIAYLKYVPYGMLLDTIVHEIGHIKRDLPYETVEERIISEYGAERYAIDTIRRVCPQYLPEIHEHTIAWILRNKKNIGNSTHLRAYLRLKEYKGVI